MRGHVAPVPTNVVMPQALDAHRMQRANKWETTEHSANNELNNDHLSAATRRRRQRQIHDAFNYSQGIYYLFGITCFATLMTAVIARSGPTPTCRARRPRGQVCKPAAPGLARVHTASSAALPSQTPGGSRMRGSVRQGRDLGEQQQ